MRLASERRSGSSRLRVARPSTSTAATGGRFPAVDAWLEAAGERLARETGSERSEYVLSQANIDDLLELARVGAHESGQRINAPLVCYLAGLASGRHGTPLEDLVDAVIGKQP